MKFSRRVFVKWLLLGVTSSVLIFIIYIVLLLLAEYLFGGEHIVIKGRSYGFTIGMTKAEVFDRYFELEEDPNIRVFAPSPRNLLDKPNDHWNLFERPKTIELPDSFLSSDHWMGFRSKWPVYFQDFYFSDDRLTTISTYIRFYETP